MTTTCTIPDVTRTDGLTATATVKPGKKSYTVSIELRRSNAFPQMYRMVDHTPAGLPVGGPARTAVNHALRELRTDFAKALRKAGWAVDPIAGWWWEPGSSWAQLLGTPAVERQA